MMTKEDTKAIEKELSLKEIRVFLKTLDMIGKKNLTIPNIRAYAQDRILDKK